jgi:preprotein translocase SecE subunit
MRGLFFLARYMRALLQYFQEAIHELRQVKWPTQQHAVRISIITVIFVITSMFIVGVFDLTLSKINTLIHSSDIAEQLQTTESITTEPVTITPEDITIDATTAEGEAVEAEAVTTEETSATASETEEPAPETE